MLCQRMSVGRCCDHHPAYKDIFISLLTAMGWWCWTTASRFPIPGMAMGLRREAGGVFRDRIRRCPRNC